MQRVTVTLDDDLMAELDRVIALKGYQNRSEAIRDLARAGLREAAAEGGDEPCVAALVYVYDHATRALSKRLVQSYHDHHDLALATMHIHVDHDNCLEVTVARGPTGEVQRMADGVFSERGVRHGRLVLIPAEIVPHRHAHDDAPGRPHDHLKPR